MLKGLGKGLGKGASYRRKRSVTGDLCEQTHTCEPRDRSIQGRVLPVCSGELSQAVLCAFLNELVPRSE